jgi:hypothetical protein
MPWPSHPPLLDHSNYTWWTIQVMKLLVMQFSPASYHFIPLWSKYSPENPVPRYLQSMFLSLMSETKFHTHTEPQKQTHFN